MLYKLVFKRFGDIMLASLLLVLASPVLLAVVVALFFNNSGTPFFFQTRPGRNGRLFRIIKLKTMTDSTDREGNLLDDELRITAFGHFIRKYSIDELPQLINILSGDMSFVGPRPLLQEYLPLYDETQKRRHAVRPGITGWAQVNGRNAITWAKKFEYDVWYVDNVSLRLDMKILLLTLVKVLRSEGISQGGHATMEKFKGNMQ